MKVAGPLADDAEVRFKEGDGPRWRLRARSADKLLVFATNGRFYTLDCERLPGGRGFGEPLAPPAKARVCAPAEGDRVAVVGDNRKLLIFPLDELPVMSRGRGARLQRYSEGGLADATVFAAAEGLSWRQGSRTLTDMERWTGKRGVPRLPQEQPFRWRSALELEFTWTLPTRRRGHCTGAYSTSPFRFA